MDTAGHDANLTSSRRNDTRAVGTDQTGARAAQGALDRNHVEDRDAFGDADHQLDTGVDRFEDRVAGKRRRH